MLVCKTRLRTPVRSRGTRETSGVARHLKTRRTQMSETFMPAKKKKVHARESTITGKTLSCWVASNSTNDAIEHAPALTALTIDICETPSHGFADGDTAHKTKKLVPPTSEKKTADRPSTSEPRTASNTPIAAPATTERTSRSASRIAGGTMGSLFGRFIPNSVQEAIARDDALSDCRNVPPHPCTDLRP